jgi:hypothetical protein
VGGAFLSAVLSEAEDEAMTMLFQLHTLCTLLTKLQRHGLERIDPKLLARLTTIVLARAQFWCTYWASRRPVSPTDDDDAGDGGVGFGGAADVDADASSRVDDAVFDAFAGRLLAATHAVSQWCLGVFRSVPKVVSGGSVLQTLMGGRADAASLREAALTNVRASLALHMHACVSFRDADAVSGRSPSMLLL